MKSSSNVICKQLPTANESNYQCNYQRAEDLGARLLHIIAIPYVSDKPSDAAYPEKKH